MNHYDVEHVIFAPAFVILMTDTWPVKRCIIIIISGRCIESFLGNVPVNKFSKIGLHSCKLWPKIKGVVFSLKHDVHVGIGCENLPTGVIPGWVWRKHQKIRKLKKPDYSLRPPTSSRQNVVLFGGWSAGAGCKFLVSSKSVRHKWFPSCRGRNLPYLSALAIGL